MKSSMALPVVTEKRETPALPWSEKTKGERLSEIVDLGLEQSREILSLRFDPDDRTPGNLKLISIISNTAISIISQQARLDRAALRAAGGRELDDDQFFEKFGRAPKVD